MNQGQREWPKVMLRLPPDAKEWITAQALLHGTSQNGEIVRAIRQRMEREKEAAPEGVAPPTEA